MHIDELTHIIIGIAISIHRQLGPGLFESVYQAALAYELQKAGIPFEKEKIPSLLSRCDLGYWLSM